MTGEFEGIGLVVEARSGPMARPKPMQATKKFIQHVSDNLDLVPGSETAAADFILNMMERYAAQTARPVMDMEGRGPQCSTCSTIWPLCGHHHMSEELTTPEEPEND